MPENITRGRYIASQIEDMTGVVWSKTLHDKVAGYIEAQLSPANDEADHARKRATKIRESFLASVRANVNLLASMTADERMLACSALAPKDAREGFILHGKRYVLVHDANTYAREKARALMIETWGAEAVDAALGGGGA